MSRIIKRMDIKSNMRTLKMSMILHMRTLMNLWSHMISNMSRNTTENTSPTNTTITMLILNNHMMRTIILDKNIPWILSRNNQKNN